MKLSAEESDPGTFGLGIIRLNNDSRRRNKIEMLKKEIKALDDCVKTIRGY